MNLVPETPNKELLWEEVFEVNSLEEFAATRAQKERALGVTNRRFSVMAPNRVQHFGADGKVIMTYRVCSSEKPYRVL